MLAVGAEASSSSSRLETERRSHCPRPADLYQICDVDWLMETFKDDWFFHTAMAKKRIGGVDVERLRTHAESFGLRFDATDADAIAESAGQAHTVIGLPEPVAAGATALITRRVRLHRAVAPSISCAWVTWQAMPERGRGDMRRRTGIGRDRSASARH